MNHPVRTTDEIYMIEKKIFLICGAYPLRSNKYVIPSMIALILLIFGSLGQFVPLSLQLPLAENLSKATDTSLILCSQGAYLSKLINFLCRRNLIIKIEDFLDDPIVEEAYKNRNEYLETQLIHLRYLKNFYRGVCMAVVLFYGLVPFMDEGMSIPQESWYPVDLEKYHTSIWIFQIVTLMITAGMNSTLDLYTASLIVIGSSFLNILKEKLTALDYSTDSLERRNYELEYCVKLHKHALEYISIVESMFSYGILVQFLASIAVICLTGFQMLVVPIPSAQFLMLISYISCMMCQVSIYCWYGNEILTESDGISTACYMSNWYEGTAKSKKVLILMMERSKKEINLTAGKFVTLSLTTLVLILKSSYSYFAVLQRVYKDN